MASNAATILRIGLIFLFPAILNADTLTLKNGYQIHGKISRELSTEKEWVIELNATGTFTVPRKQVSRIEINDLTETPAQRPSGGEPGPASLKGMVAVHMKKHTGYNVFYGERPLYGIQSEKSTGEVLVLGIPGAGEVRIPRRAVEKIVPSELLPARVAPAIAAPGIIKTTHRVELKNGEVLRGTLVQGPENEPLKLDLDAIGRLYIPRERIASVEEEAGRIVLPEPSPEHPAEEEKPGAAEKPEKAGKAGTPGKPKIVIAIPAAPIDPDLKEEIERDLHDLSRWRSRNRVRAERDLKRIGRPAIPLLDAVASNPFELTRRAVMRIVRDVGDPAGIPLAIEGLLDVDGFVREISAEALRRITGMNFKYYPYASIKRRQEAYQRWEDWLRDNVIIKTES